MGSPRQLSGSPVETVYSKTVVGGVNEPEPVEKRALNSEPTSRGREFDSVAALIIRSRFNRSSRNWCAMDDATYDPLYLKGIELFNACEFFESHEAWEELWQQDFGPSRKFLQGLIQA